MGNGRTVVRAAFGRALRSRRKEIGISASEVGRRLECDASTVSRMERGEVSVAVDEVPDIARALDIAPRRLLAVIMGGGKKTDTAQAA